MFDKGGNFSRIDLNSRKLTEDDGFYGKISFSRLGPLSLKAMQPVKLCFSSVVIHEKRVNGDAAI